MSSGTVRVSPSVMRARVFVCAALVAGLPLAADDVYLRNGNSFEGVVTQSTGSEVLILLPFGSLSLPRSSVLRIEKSATDQATYFERFDELVSSETAQAADWLELARWARTRGLDHSASEAAQRAALLEPDLEGLEPILRGLGYVLDEEIGRWLPYEDFMRRRGFVFEAGRWMTPEELAARERARREELEVRRAEARDQRFAQAVELLALSQVERLQDERQQRYRTGGVAGFPVAVFHGAVIPAAIHTVGFISHPVIGFSGSPGLLEQLLHRQPGSLLPVGPKSSDPGAPSVMEQHLRRQPGSLFPVGHNHGVFAPTGR